MNLKERQNKYLSDLQNRWCTFKKCRNLYAYFDKSHEAFMTIQEREKLIDELFQYINVLKNRKKIRSFIEGLK